MGKNSQEERSALEAFGALAVDNPVICLEGQAVCLLLRKNLPNEKVEVHGIMSPYATPDQIETVMKAARDSGLFENFEDERPRG